MAPEIDGLIYVNINENIKIGSFIPVKVNEADEYDLKERYLMNLANKLTIIRIFLFQSF